MVRSHALTLGVLSIGIAVAAGTADSLRFDVVSIRPNPPRNEIIDKGEDFTPILAGGRFIDDHASVEQMILLAYRIPNEDQLVGLPAWAFSTMYAVSAKADHNYSAPIAKDNKERVRAMLRTMLADRFQLQLRTETRQEKGLSLQVARGGVKIKTVPAPIPPAVEGTVNCFSSREFGRFDGKTVTMADLVNVLAVTFRQPVVDETGVKSYFDLMVKWDGDGPDSPGEFGTPDFIQGAISALQADLGVHFVPRIIPSQYWVVTHVEKPTAN